MNLVLSAQPLTSSFRMALEGKLGENNEYLGLSGLKKSSPLALWRALRSARYGAVYVALEDDEGKSLLPILKMAAALTKGGSLQIVDKSVSLEPFSRLDSMRSSINFVSACVSARYAKTVCEKEMSRLIRAGRVACDHPESAEVVYINTDFWFGPKVGGSIGHVAGVVNGFARAGRPVSYYSATDPVMLDAKVERRSIKPLGTFGLPMELNQLRFHRSFYRQAKPMVERRPSFIYQRMSLLNYTGVALSRRLRTPLVIEYNGSNAWIIEKWGRGALRNAEMARRAEDVCIRHAHLLVTVSEVLRDELISRGAEPERVVWYPNCVDEAVFDPSRFSPDEVSAMKNRLGLPENGVVVTFMGTFGAWHGAEVFAKAIAGMAQAKDPSVLKGDIRFLLVGDGERMGEVRRILENAAADHCVITGLVPQEQAPLYLACSDICVSPHATGAGDGRFFGSPTKLFEYMAMGKAIVASELEQIGEVLENSLKARDLDSCADDPGDAGEMAVLAEPGDVEELKKAIMFLAGNSAWRRRLGANARAEVQRKYTWRRHVARIMDGLDGTSG